MSYHEERIRRDYNPEYDLHPNGPKVTWADMALQEQITQLKKQLAEAQERIDELEGKHQPV